MDLLPSYVESAKQEQHRRDFSAGYNAYCLGADDDRTKPDAWRNGWTAAASDEGRA